MLLTRNSSLAWQPLSRVNLTDLTTLTSVQDRKYLSSKKEKKTTRTHMQTSLKIGFAQISLAAQILGRLQHPPRPGPYAYGDTRRFCSVPKPVAKHVKGLPDEALTL